MLGGMVTLHGCGDKKNMKLVEKTDYISFGELLLIGTSHVCA